MLWRREGERLERDVLVEAVDAGRARDDVEVEAEAVDMARSGFLRMLGISCSAVVVESVG